MNRRCEVTQLFPSMARLRHADCITEFEGEAEIYARSKFFSVDPKRPLRASPEQEPTLAFAK
jgi:hypothetical protein